MSRTEIRPDRTQDFKDVHFTVSESRKVIEDLKLQVYCIIKVQGNHLRQPTET